MARLTTAVTTPVQQLALSLILAAMVFAVALELRVTDFRRVAQMPLAILAGLVPQFALLPLATLAAVLLLDLPAAIEAGMLLVACCPGGSLSNVITHYGGGNTAYSLSLSAVAALLALLLTPFNFAWTMSANPATRAWLNTLSLSALDVAAPLVLLLGLPLGAGLLLSSRRPALAARLQPTLKWFGLLALAGFILVGLVRDRALLTAALLLPATIVVAHNAAGLLLGSAFARLCRLGERERRAVTVEAGMQNSGLALGIIALQFESELGMVLIASLWGIWHIVSGLAIAEIWRIKDARSRL